MLEIKEVCKNFGGLRAVDKCSLTVKEKKYHQTFRACNEKVIEAYLGGKK